jgi:glycosyltransferase involved in cell wall biosynthesis
MAPDMRILVLHSRLSGYWMACMRVFVKEYKGDFFVVRKKASANAPFDFENEPGIQLFDFSSFSDKELIKFCKDKNPDLVYVSGWSEQVYLKIARHFCKKKIPVICGLDNHWEGTIRQQAGKFYLKHVAPKTFTHLWIPDSYQFEYARHLGFAKENILTGLYSADVEAFSKARKESKKEPYPKSFLFVGRFIERKGLIELAQAFEELKKTTDSEWALTLIGNGPLKERLKEFDHVEILDFVQPEELPQVMSTHGVFVLPSHVEPWGVVVHEAAAAGVPIISTYSCGAAATFVRNGYNGYFTEAGNVHSLKNALELAIQKSDPELYEMGRRSAELSLQHTPQSWASTLYQLI